MNKDLKWLSENLNEWPIHQTYAAVCHGANGTKVVFWDCGSNLGETFTESQWQSARDELIGKPSWDDAPRWVEWIAQWYDGQWLGYEVKPEDGSKDDPADCYVDTRKKTRIHYFGYGEVIGDWRDTLERRPYVGSLDSDEAFGKDLKVYGDQKPWSGPEDGLPPVGVTLLNEFNEPRTVVAIDGDVIVCRCDDSDGYRGYTPAEQKLLKPMPTEEDKAVDEMKKIIDGACWNDDICRKLYRAGYRK